MSQSTSDASDAHLDSLITWAMQREQDKRAAQQLEAVQPIKPTFPDGSVSLPKAERAAAAAVAAFADSGRCREKPETLLAMTVGSGKSHTAIMALPELLSAAHAAGREGAIYYFVPRHDLGDELLARIRDVYPTLKVAIWRGMDQTDRDAPPDDPARTMCADRALSGAAMAAAQSATAGCKACKWFPPKRGGAAAEAVCGYIRQASMRPDVWLMPHNLLFQRKPAGLPDAALVVVDENFTGAALAGTDALSPVQIPVTALDDARTGPLTGLDCDRLLFLRSLARDAFTNQPDDGGLLRAAFTRVGFTAETASEWIALEWRTKPEVKITVGMDRDGAVEAFTCAAAQGFTKLRPMLAARVRDLLTGTDARSVNVTLLHNVIETEDGMTDVIRFAWREDFADWIAEAPKLFLDATTRSDVLRCSAPDLDVVDIEVSAPHQHVRQIVGAEFGRTMFRANLANVRRLADLVMVELATIRGDMLVITQAAVEELLRAELMRRFSRIPPRLAIRHHGDITGLDAHRDANALIVVGRPATNRPVGERLAELLRGTSVATLAAKDAARWPTITAGIRLADGTGRAVRQPQHPDRLVEAVRWSITESAVMQAIGRARGVRRDPATPVRVTVLAELALPLTVAEVVDWQDAQPGRIAVAISEAALTHSALPLAPADLAAARPDLFKDAKAAEYALGREKLPESSYKEEEPLYKGFRVVFPLLPARYRRAGARGPLASALVPAVNSRAALELFVGPLSAFDVDRTILPTAVEIAALSDADKLVLRARLAGSPAQAAMPAADTEIEASPSPRRSHPDAARYLAH